MRPAAAARLGVVAAQGAARVLLPDADALRVVQRRVAVHVGGRIQVGRVERAVHPGHQLVEVAAHAVGRLVELRQRLRAAAAQQLAWVSALRACQKPSLGQREPLCMHAWSTCKA